MTRNIVVVGCGAGGGTAAQFAKKTDREANVIVLEKGKFPQYSKCALPYLISGKVRDVVEFSEKWFERAGIELLLETEAIRIDKEKKLLYFIGKKEEKIRYDSLIIASGAKARIPRIEGIKTKNNKLKRGIFVLRTIEDAMAIKSYMEKSKKALIVGAGLIGLELAEALQSKGIDVTVIEIFPNILPSFLDPDLSSLLLEKLKNYLDIRTDCKLVKVKGNQRFRSTVKIGEKEEEIVSDMIILCTGISPEVSLAREVGCRIGEKGGIIINRRCETTIKNIYAAGDCTEYRDMVTGRYLITGLGSTAVKQGIVAGINTANGYAELPEGFIQTRTAKLFGIEIAAAGPISKLMGDVTYGKYKGKTLPHYYPGGGEIVIKVMIDKEEKIVGMQAIGDGAALRANTVALAMLSKTKASDFRKIETAYAPPIAPALDPLIIACEIALKKYGK